MPFPAILLLLIGTLENVWPFIEGIRHTPTGYYFLGTVHHPADYFYYLSQFAQGKERLLTTVDLFTDERIRPSFVGWTNVLSGKLFSLIQIPPVWAYEACIVLGTILVFVAVYRLAVSVLGSVSAATHALTLFTLYHAFPMTRDGQPSYGDYYSNYAVPRVRLGGVPHQLLIAASSIFLMTLASNPAPSKKTRVAILVTSVILASLQPVLWGLLLIPMTLSRQWKNLGCYSAGLVPILYLQRLFSTLPFSQLRAWESLQQTPLTIEHFVMATGPVFLIALFALPVFLFPGSPPRRMLGFFTAASLMLFLSPIPAFLGLSHVRFMSTLTIAGLSVIASYGLWSLKRPIISWGVVVLLAVILIPNHLITIRISSAFDADNMFQYIPLRNKELMDRIAVAGSDTDVTLVRWPYNVVFPGITGRTGFDGHPLLTIRSQEKSALSERFFSGTESLEWMRSFLAGHRITAILSPPLPATLESSLSLERKGATPELVWYQVSR